MILLNSPWSTIKKKSYQKVSRINPCRHTFRYRETDPWTPLWKNECAKHSSAEKCQFTPCIAIFFQCYAVLRHFFTTECVPAALHGPVAHIQLWKSSIYAVYRCFFQGWKHQFFSLGQPTLPIRFVQLLCLSLPSKNQYPLLSFGLMALSIWASP